MRAEKYIYQYSVCLYGSKQFSTEITCNLSGFLASMSGVEGIKSVQSVCVHLSVSALMAKPFGIGGPKYGGKMFFDNILDKLEGQGRHIENMVSEISHGMTCVVSFCYAI